MTDLHATVVRIATQQPVTMRGLLLRIPAARPDADRAVRDLIETGALKVSRDGTLKYAPPKPVKARKRPVIVRRAQIVSALSGQPMTAAAMAAHFGVTKNAIEQHVTAMLANASIRVTGYAKRHGVRGYAPAIYGVTGQHE